MKYFITEEERKARHSTCFHEFYKGKWDGKTFWNFDSICLDDDNLTKGLIKAIKSVVDSYDPYDITEISKDEWYEIGQTIDDDDQISRLIYEEADQWLKSVFEEYGCFTILGI